MGWTRKVNPVNSVSFFGIQSCLAIVFLWLVVVLVFDHCLFFFVVFEVNRRGKVKKRHFCINH